MQNLPRTKFFPPVLHREIIPRANLGEWLRREIPLSRLVLVTAPAGYGKTTLLATLPEALPEYRLAWLGLDREDNDLVRFLSGLGECLGGIHPELGRVIADQLAASTGLISGGAAVLPVRQVVVSLINKTIELGVGPCILVLDDLHEIQNPLIFEALEYLLENISEQVHLAVAARYEPPMRLNRLRARRQIAELDISALRFNREESLRFLNEILQFDIQQKEAEDLYRLSEGWPVGLVLIGSRLRGKGVTQTSGISIQQLERIDASTFHYLADEVLALQPPDVREFMLETCVLPELTPSLCGAISGRADAAENLAYLCQRHLFLTQVNPSLSTDEPVYRYHALFAGFLEQELLANSPQRYRDLHQRAALVEKDAGRVLYHFIKAQNWEGAAQKIESLGEAYLENGLQETVSGWVAALPKEIVSGRYRLLYIEGLAALLKGDLGPAQLSLEASLALLDQGEDDRATRGQVLVGLASLAFIRADFEHSLRLINQGEAYTTGGREKIDFLMLRASLSLFCKSDEDQATRDLDEALSLVLASNDMRLWFIFSLYLAPEFLILPGMITRLEAFCNAARQRYGEQISPLRLGVEDTWAAIYLRRGRLLQAIETSRDVMAVKDQLGGYPFLGMNACLAAGAAYSGLGNYSAAEEFLQRAIRQVEQAELNQALAGGGLYPMGRLCWLQGKFDEAQEKYQRLLALETRLPLVGALQEMLAGLLEIAAARYPAAEKHLLEAVRLQRSAPVSEIYGSARLLLAVLYYRWKNVPEAIKQVEAVLAHCEKHQIPGLILQDMPLAAPLLRLAVEKGVRAGQAGALLNQMGLGVEEDDRSTLLTGRQMEILGLMAAGYSNQAIADKLSLSLSTVKSHAVHILNRLGASSRMEAVAIARKMGLL